MNNRNPPQKKQNKKVDLMKKKNKTKRNHHLQVQDCRRHLIIHAKHLPRFVIFFFAISIYFPENG